MHDDLDLETLSDSELYKKLLGKTPYVKPWMEPFLPSNIYLRDGLVGSLAMSLFMIPVIGSSYFLTMWLGDREGFMFSLIPLGIAAYFGLGVFQARYTGATVKMLVIKKRRKELQVNSK